MHWSEAMSDGESDRDDHLYRPSSFAHFHHHHQHDDGGGDTSSDDDIQFVTGGGGGGGGSRSGAARFGYTTFGNEDDDEGGHGLGGTSRAGLGLGGKDEAIYGVFASGGDSDGGDTGGGRRKRRRTGATRNGGGGVSFVKSSQVEGKPKAAETDGEDTNADKDTNKKEEEKEEEEAERRHRKEEMEASNARFQALLERGRQNRRGGGSSNRTGLGIGSKSTPITDTKSSQSQEDTEESRTSGLGAGGGGGRGGLGLGATSTSTDGGDDRGGAADPMPSLSSFVSSSSAAAAGLGMASSTAASGMKRKRDPNLGTWEKHTKGIGMKLLAKMGYSGSGGLGAKRVRKKAPSSESATVSEQQAPAIQRGSMAASTHADENEVVHRKGISRAIEVVVRPQNLGLGFGNFVEQSQLRVNRQIEAEVRGIDIKKQEDEERKRQLEKGGGDDDIAAMLGISKSLLPSTQALMSEGGWRKGGRRGRSGGNADVKKRKERKFVSYQDVVKGEAARGEQKIIDMRGPSAAALATFGAASSDAPPTVGGGKVPLGEELLHNVTLLLNTNEDKVRSASQYVKSNQKKVESLKSEVTETEHRLEDVKTRIAKLEKVLDIFDRMERLHNDQIGPNGGSGTDATEEDRVIVQAASLIDELGRNFSKEEKQSLRFYSDIVPALLAPIVESKLSSWKPLTRDTAEQSELLMTSIVVDLCAAAVSDSNGRDEDDNTWCTKHGLFVAHILPRIKKSFQSSRWDPIRDVDGGLALYEAVLRVAKDASPSTRHQPKREDDEDVLLEQPFTPLGGDFAQDLTAVVRDDIMYAVIFPKVARCLSQYKPSSSLLDVGTGKIQTSALHLWLLPWLPYLDYRSMLSTLLPDVKRKLRNILAYLSRTYGAGQDELFFPSSTDILRPWRDILDARTLQTISSDVLVPRLGRYLSRIQIAKAATDQDWKCVDVLYCIHENGLLSDRDLLSLLEGEILAPWAEHLHFWLASKDYDLKNVATFYAKWKCKLFSSPSSSSLKPSSPDRTTALSVVAKDPVICCHFYAGLRMIDAVIRNDADALDDLTPPSSGEVTFQSVLARRAKEDRQKAEAAMRARVADEQSALGHNANHSAHQRNGGVATFREVVEDFARRNDIVFTPRFGANSTKDGKQVFSFGGVSIYLDKDVVFAQRASSWYPTSLEDLALAANS